jgi:putative oxidoreductase
VNRTLPEPTRDVALLVARLLLGTIMFAHGYQKLMIDGLGRTTQGFESMSIPVAIVSAAFVTVVEIVGGILVILGALLTVVAAFYLVVMVGAAVFVHIPNGIFVGNNGWELVGSIAALLLALAAAGSGRYGIDHVIRSRQSPAPSFAPAAAPAPTAPAAAGPAWPSRPVPRHDHSARAAAFTDVFPQVSADAPATPLPVRRPRHTSSSPPTSPPAPSAAPPFAPPPSAAAQSAPAQSAPAQSGPPPSTAPVSHTAPDRDT